MNTEIIKIDLSSSELKIIRNAVQSSNILSIGYNETFHILDVEFKENEIYRYAKVPPEIYSGLMESPSKGSFMAKNIKGKFEYRIYSTHPIAENLAENKG